MKKALMFATLAIILGTTLTACGSLRTPTAGKNQNVSYFTFFGLSIESACYGDGIIVDMNNK